MTIPFALDDADRKLLTDADHAAILWRKGWLDKAFAPDRRGKQVPPEGPWDQLIFKSGRGWGKSAAEIQWLSWEGWRVPNLILHAVAPTLNDCRGTLFLGPAGFRATIPPECLRGGNWEAACDISHLELHLKNGTLIRGFGATDAGGRLRGPQCHGACGDELREWDHPAGNLEAVHYNLMFGCRLPYPDGTPSRVVFGTTPKPIPFLKNLYRRKGVVVVTGTTYENLSNLSSNFRNTIMSYEGTQIGRAEIYGEDVDSDQNGIFQRKWFRLWPNGKKLPEFQHIVMSMDTAMSDESYDQKTGDTDYSACVILGVFNTRECFSEAELKKLGVKSKYAALVCDVWNERLGFPELCEKARDWYRKKWGGPPGGVRGPLIGPKGDNYGRRPDIVLIEAKNSGISLRQTLMQYGIPTWPYDPRGQSKGMRAHAASPLVMQGMLFVPESGLPDRKGMPRDWCEPLVEQMSTFAGKGSIPHDDIVDSVTQSMLYLSERGMFQAEPSQRGYPDMDEKDDMDKREAVAIAQREKRSKRGNPYM